MIRDRIEALLRRWNTVETRLGAPPVVDYDYTPPATGAHAFHQSPDGSSATEPDTRIGILSELASLCREAEDEGERAVARRCHAHLTYLRALLGERLPLRSYVQGTQGVSPTPWPADYVAHRRQLAVDALDAVEVGWSADILHDLRRIDGQVELDDAPGLLRAAAARHELEVRKLVGTSAPHKLRIEIVDLDAYWGYWVDGARGAARLRINRRHAAFTQSELEQFAIHEVLGHALQCAAWYERACNEDAGAVRLSSVHAQEQILLEGWAQAAPLFMSAVDPIVLARLRLAHYDQLVRAQVHIALGDGVNVARCIEFARRSCPYWTDNDLGGVLHDRGVDPLLRSYLWSYPAGFDWFVQLHERAAADDQRRVLTTAYQRPLTPEDLHALWPGDEWFVSGRTGALDLRS